jgi:nitrite reductase/ring-hydroxylating ferredoxin subunit
MSRTVALCPYDSLYPGTADRFEVEGHRIALVRIGDTYYAIGNVCTHAEFLLSDGEVDCDERTIECWKHGALFSLETGEALTLPATRATPVYEIVIEDEQVKVVLP